MNRGISTMTSLNPPIIDLGEISEPPDFETENYKYCQLRHIKTNPFIWEVLEKMMAVCGDGLVDIKVHNLKAGQYPCRPQWHLDGSPDPKRPSDYCIAVFGETLTEFMTTPFNCDYYTEDKNPENYESVLIKSGHIYQYTNRNVHRCSLCQKDETRLLIRMTNAKVTPQGKFTPRAYNLIDKPKSPTILECSNA